MWRNIEQLPHFKCKILNENNNDFDMEKILNEFVEEKKQHLDKWRENMKKLITYQTSGTSLNTVCQ